MVRLCLLFALVVLASVGQASAANVKASEPKLNPPLKNVASDKKFFGPPFPADYPDDKRPVVSKAILDKLKSPDQPYPALQSRDDYDRDFVKDENSDKGAWQAQFEYDALRRKLANKESDEHRAADRAAREGRDVDDARRQDEDADKKVRDAQKDVDDASAFDPTPDGDSDDAGTAPSSDELDAMKKRVAEAEAKYAQAAKNFKECERQLKEAKEKLESLRAQQKALEEKLAADTKLWAEQKTVRLNLKKTKEAEADSQVKAAAEKLTAAEKVKADLESALSKEKAEHEKAQEDLKKEKARMEAIKKAVEKASQKLQEVHGYKPAAAKPAPSKSEATGTWWSRLVR